MQGEGSFLPYHINCSCLSIRAAFFVALLVAGQMVASVAFDHFGALGLSEHPVDIPRLIGAVLLVVGVALIRI